MTRAKAQATTFVPQGKICAFGQGPAADAIEGFPPEHIAGDVPGDGLCQRRIPGPPQPMAHIISRQRNPHR